MVISSILFCFSRYVAKFDLLSPKYNIEILLKKGLSLAKSFGGGIRNKFIFDLTEHF